VANQWDDLPRSIQTACAFLLLIIPQVFCGYVIVKMPEKIIWRECSALLLFFGVGASISLVSQIYNIHGEMSSFMLTWTLLTVPLIYLLNSSTVSLAYLYCIMVYAISARHNATSPIDEYLFWLLFILPLPRYYRLLTKPTENILVILHHWMIPLVLSVTLGTLAHGLPLLMNLNYVIMFGIFYFISNTTFLKKSSIFQNGYKAFGFPGTIIALLIMTFKNSWRHMAEENYHLNNLILAPEFIAFVILIVLASLLLYRQNKHIKLLKWDLFNVVYLFSLLIFIIGTWDSSLATILINLLVFALAILMVRAGTLLNHLGVINIGMLVIALLVICRSFDADLTFVVKGTLFVLVGIGFFVSNWLMIKKRTKDEV